jgi:hypothetical protein
MYRILCSVLVCFTVVSGFLRVIQSGFIYAAVKFLQCEFLLSFFMTHSLKGLKIKVFRLRRFDAGLLPEVTESKESR